MRWKHRLIMVVTAGAGAILLLAGGAQAQSGCITCHTDEDLLEDSAAETETAKKSVLQAGAG